MSETEAEKRKGPEFRKGMVLEMVTDPTMLYVRRVRVSGRATSRAVPVQTWLGGERWGKPRMVRPATLRKYSVRRKTEEA